MSTSCAICGWQGVEDVVPCPSCGVMAHEDLVRDVEAVAQEFHETMRRLEHGEPRVPPEVYFTPADRGKERRPAKTGRNFAPAASRTAGKTPSDREGA